MFTFEGENFSIMWNDIIYGIGDFLTETFKILPVLGNKLNTALIIVGFVLLFFWLNKMANYNKKAKAEGTLK